MPKDDFPREKKWRHLYLRSEKLHRAKQLGIDYPRRSESEVIAKSVLNVLFVCSRNQWRSPTAEKVFSTHSLLKTRSRGTSPRARVALCSSDIKWSDVIMVMEKKHKQRITAKFPGETKYKEIHVLGIEDNYRFMDDELIEVLQDCVVPILFEENA